MTMPNFSPAAAWNNESATTAVEFAIVAPVFILLSIGVIYLCLGTLRGRQLAVCSGGSCTLRLRQDHDLHEFRKHSELCKKPFLWSGHCA
jgi:hypothetical protein